MYDDIFGQFRRKAGGMATDIDMIAIAVTPYSSEEARGDCALALNDHDYKEFIHFGIKNIEPIMIADTDPPSDSKPYLIDFDFQNYMLYPVYFDWKVADTSSSFPNIYLRGVIPERDDFGLLLRNPLDRSPINKLAESIKTIYFEEM